MINITPTKSFQYKSMLVGQSKSMLADKYEIYRMLTSYLKQTGIASNKKENREIIDKLKSSVDKHKDTAYNEDDKDTTLHQLGRVISDFFLSLT